MRGARVLSSVVIGVSLLIGAGAAAAAECRPALDAQMVRFVPKTPSSGPNPLFRLIAHQASPATGAKPDCKLGEFAAAGGR